MVFWHFAGLAQLMDRRLISARNRFAMHSNWNLRAHRGYWFAQIARERLETARSFRNALRICSGHAICDRIDRDVLGVLPRYSWLGWPGRLGNQSEVRVSEWWSDPVGVFQ